MLLISNKYSPDRSLLLLTIVIPGCVRAYPSRRINDEPGRVRIRNNRAYKRVRPQLIKRLLTDKFAQIIFINANVRYADNLIINFPLSTGSRFFTIGQVFRQIEGGLSPDCWHRSVRYPPWRRISPAASGSGSASTPNTGNAALIVRFQRFYRAPWPSHRC